MRTFVELEEARTLVMGSVSLLEVEVVALDAAPGRTLAEDVHADMDIPPYRNAAMDGYAVRAEDVRVDGTVLPLSGAIRAGEWPDSILEAGTCWSITTGSPIPDGADTVIPVEETAAEAEGRVRFTAGVERGRHVRDAGRDMRAGDGVLGAGTRVGPAEAGILAMVGKARVRVRRSPTVAVVATGDEIVAPDLVPGPGQIRNSNASALAAQIVAAGGTVSRSLHARDDRDSTAAVIESVRGSDAIVISGGVSMGSHDIVRDVLLDAGMEPLFWKVRQRPGKPLSYGLLDGHPVFGLPGNPVSSSVCFDQYVRPALAAMLGRTQPWRTRLTAHLTEDVPKPAGLHVFARGIATTAADGTLSVETTGPQGSNLFTSMLRANCLVHLPAALDRAQKGQLVEIEWLSW